MSIPGSTACRDCLPRLADLDRDAADDGEILFHHLDRRDHVPGVSGVLTHTYTFEVDHDFRRWLTAIGKFTYGTLDYQGDGRLDKVYSIEGDLIYKMTRYFWIRAPCAATCSTPTSSARARPRP